MTATRNGTVKSLRPSVTFSAKVHTSTCARPHDGHETISRVRSRSPMYSRSLVPTLTSSTGGADKDTRIVSPMPSERRTENADTDLMVPWNAGPASVTPRCSGQSPFSDSWRYASTMVRTSWCFTEILKSWKSFSSNSDASQTADSTRASGVALPYFFSRRGSSEPAFTPMRKETPASDAALQISFTWSSNLRMLPGFTRTAPQPASMAANTYFGLK